MAIVFENDFVGGKQTQYAYNPDTDTHAIKTVQDVSGLLDALAAKRALTQEHGKAEEFAHYASIPATVITELRNKGIDVFNAHQTKELLREINTNYRYLKATTKHHA